MSLKMNSYSRTGLATCLALGLASCGCASWNTLIGKKKEASPQLNLSYAKLQEQGGDFTGARHKYEEVLAKDPNNVDAILGMARLNVKAQRLVEAEDGYKKALALKPKSTEVLSEIGNFYADQQRWDKALPLLQDCQHIEPHEKKFQYNLAVALAKSGQTKEALPHFKEAVGDGAAHYNIGRILIESGKRKEAEEQFVIALAKDKNLTDAQYWLDEIRASNGGKAEQLPAIVDAGQRKNSTQQVAATAPVRTAEAPNPFEDAPTSGFSRSDTPPARQVKNTRAPNQPASGHQVPNGRQQRTPPSGRQPLYPHEGVEELAPPPEYNEGSADQNSASSKSYASSIILASAEEPAKDSTPPQSSTSTTPPRLILPHRLIPPATTTETP
ncbi:MAG: cellulose synthase subunit BcsC [Planctomycetaceae bacterium]|nr:cellulose synthase subunit BcsC [Planctomycetaceae bacterium]